MKSKIFIFCILIAVIGMTRVYAQIFATPFSDEIKITTLLNDIVNAINKGKLSEIESIFTQEALNSKEILDSNLINGYIKEELNLSIKSVNIIGDKARVKCYLAQIDGKNMTEDEIELENVDGQWKVNYSKLLLPIYLSLQSINNVYSGLDNNKYNTVNIRYSQRMFIPKNVPGTDYFKVTESHMINNLGKSLFFTPIDIEYVRYTEINGNFTFLGFYLDRGWNRIVVHKVVTDHNYNIINSLIVSYGDKSNEYKFYCPEGLSYAECGEIYIADRGNRQIVKITIDRNNLTFTMSDIIKLAGIYYPSDIVYDNNNTSQLSDDWIWVTDPNAQKIVRLDRQFNVVQTITNYKDNYGNYVPLKMPTKIMVNNHHASYQKTLGVINYNTFVELIPGESPPFFSSVFYWSLHNFQYPTNLSSIGLEYPEGWLLLDEGNHCIHKINRFGDYIASFKSTSGSNSLFTYPKFISASGVNTGTGSNKFLDIGTIDVWGMSTGFQNFLPGADIFDFSVKEFPRSFVIEYTPTNWIKDSVKVLKKGDRTIVKDWGLHATNPEKQMLSIPKTDILHGEYIVRLSYKPYYDDIYDSYQQGWKYKEISFSTLVAPAISGFTQTPSIIYRGGSGIVRCNLSQGNGNLTYSWRAEDFPAGASVTFDGNTAFITYASKAHHEKGYAPYLFCTAQNNVGSYTHSTLVFFAKGGGCPFVYTWNGEVWVEDNNILPQSEYPENQGVDVKDYYQLFTKPKLESAEGGEKYRLAVGEFEQERSYFDQLQLLVIDHPIETFITVDDSGRVIQFAKPAYFANAELDSEDVYKQLYELDGLKTKAAVGDTLKLSFEESAVGIDKYVLLIAQVQAAAKEKIAGEVITGSGKDKETFTSFRLRRNPSYQWVSVPEGNSSSIQVDIVWKDEAEVNYTELSHKLELPFTLYTPQLLTARHSHLGDVTDLLRNWDESYAELNPNEWIDLEFSAPPVNEGMQRSFVFLSRGRYERISEQKESATGELTIKKQQTTSSTGPNIPTKYVLHQNSPNPFNPVTIIRYELPKVSYVVLKIYDILGKEVATLVNGMQDAGYKQVVFDASSTAGGLTSGIYLYKLVASSIEPLTVSTFTDVKKLVLVK